MIYRLIKIDGKIEKFSRELEPTKNNQMEVLKLTSEIENSINRFSRLDTDGKRTNNLDDRTMEIIQSEAQSGGGGGDVKY